MSPSVNQGVPINVVGEILIFVVVEEVDAIRNGFKILESDVQSFKINSHDISFGLWYYPYTKYSKMSTQLITAANPMLVQPTIIVTFGYLLIVAIMPVTILIGITALKAWCVIIWILISTITPF